MLGGRSVARALALALLLATLDVPAQAVVTGTASAGPATYSRSVDKPEYRERKTVRGVYRLLTRDVPGPDGRTHDEVRKVLELPNGKWLDLHIPERLAVSYNAPVELSGVGGETTLDVASVRHLRGREAETAYPMAALDGGAATAAASTQPATGSTSVLVILAYWTKPDAMTTAKATDVVFTQGNPWWKEASYGALTLTGRATSWLPITAPSGDCYSWSDQIMSRAKAAASAYNPGAYQRVIVYFPACGGAPGWAFVGAGSVWINGSLDQRVVIHEQGHNYGLGHAHSYPCSSGGKGVTLGGSCGIDEYGDPFDAMGGGSYVGHFSGRHKDLLGWLGASRKANLGSTDTTLTPLETATGLKAGIVNTNVSTRKYWVEYRVAIGKDKNFPVGGQGVQIRLVSSTIGDGGPLLLDARPTDTSSYDAFETVTLPAGSSWTTPEGIRIAVISTSSSGAVVKVLNATTPAAPSEPTNVVAKPGDSQASVTWTRPSTDNGSLITSYVVTSSPGGKTATVTTSGGTTTNALVGGLTNNTAYTFSVVAKNGVGPSAASTASAPVTPTAAIPSVAITSPAGGTTVTSETLPVTVTTAPSATPPSAAIDGVDYYIDGEWVDSSYASPFSRSLDLARTDPGPHALVARVYDLNGRSAASAPVSFVYAPPAPKVSITSPANNAVLTTSTAQVVLDAAAGSPSHYLRSVYATLADGTSAGYAYLADDGTWTLDWDLSGLESGKSYVLTAYATDDTDRTTASAPVTVTVVHPTPTVSITSPTGGAVQGSSALVAQITRASSFDPELSYAQLVADDVTMLQTVYSWDPAADPSGAWSFDVDWRQLANGPHTLRVKAFNEAGYAGTSAPVVVAVDNPQPSATLTSPSSNATVSGTVLVQATAQADGSPVSSMQLLAGETVVAYLSPPAGNGPWTGEWQTQYAEQGQVTLSVQVQDEAGYQGTSPGVVVQLDNPGPAITLTSPAEGAQLTGTVALTASTTPNPDTGAAPQYVEYLVDGITYQYGTDAPGWPAEIEAAWLNPGPHVLRARVTDVDGLSRSSEPVSVTTVGPPQPPSSLTGVVGQTDVELTWVAPPDDPGAPLTEYLVQRVDPDTWQPIESSTVHVPAGQLSTTLTGLTGDSVMVQVLSTGPGGSSPYALGPFVIDLLPAPVSGLTITGGNRSLALSWTPSTSGDLDQVEVRVAVSPTTPESASDPALTLGPGATGGTLTGLADGTTYKVSVLARDWGGGASAAWVGTGTTLYRNALTSAATTTITYGGTATVTGRLTRNGAGLASRSVVLQQRRLGSGAAWTTAGSYTTSATGTLTAPRKPTLNTEYRWYLATATELATASTGRAVRVATRVTAAFSATRVALNRGVYLAGSVGPNHRGQRVYLQQRIGTSWRTLTSVLLTSTSAYRFTVVGRARGTQYYRVYKPADADHAAGYSPTRSVYVF